MRRVFAAALPLFACAPDSVRSAPVARPQRSAQREPSRPAVIRVATFNAALHRPEAGLLFEDIASGHPGVEATAAVIRTVAPDLLLINELDADAQRDVPAALRRRLAAHKGPGDPVVYPHHFAPPSNTGVDSGFDLDRDGRLGGPGDAWGYGRFPGQFAWVLLSRFPIDSVRTRCFGTLRWATMPQSSLPDDPKTAAPADWYSKAILSAFPLSSKNHCDVVVQVRGRRLHVLASHPTPPVFDGPEDRNGLRNRDEIRLWSMLLDPRRSPSIVDDQGRTGGLDSNAPFVIVGDLNADPIDGDASGSPVTEFLLSDPRIIDPRPSSRGATIAAASQTGRNLEHRGPAATDTADFPDDDPGNLRVDYVLPSANLEVVNAGVFWPGPDEPGASWVAHSDHRLVWVDLRIAPRAAATP